MNFLAPGAFFLGLLLPVIVALYLLKLRRTEREVPSTYLWRRVVRDVEANAPWQKLRPNLLLILQLLFLLALILAAARPFVWSEGISGPAAIFILDTSASMNATDVAPSRIESAKERTGQLIDDLPDGARATIIAAGEEARVLLSSSLDRRQAHLAIQGIQAGTGGSDMNIALELASAIAARQPGTEIVVLSDGRVELPERLALKGRLRYLPFGLSGENQAISLLTLQPAADGSLTAFVQVSNYGDEPTARRLSLYASSTVDGVPALFNAYDLQDIPTGGQKGVIAEGLPEETRLVEARLGGADILALDDTAKAVQPDLQPVTVRLVTPGNRFLTTALNLLPGVSLSEQAVTTSSADADEADEANPSDETLPEGNTPEIWIYDGIVPDVLPVSGNIVFIAPPRSTELFTITGLAQNPSVRIVDPADPLVTNLSMAEINLLDAVTISLPAWATPVAAGDLPDGNIPLIFRGEPDGRKVIVLAFDLRRSDMPLQVSFPLLWANIINWLAPDAGSLLPAQVAPGESLTFRAPGEATAAVVTKPDGTAHEISAENGQFLFAETDQIGVYRLRFVGSEQQDTGAFLSAAFSVNLFTPNESYLKPADSLPGTLAAEEAVQGEESQAARELWRSLAFLALGLLTGEWLVYHRAALARLRDKLRGLLSRPPGRKRTV